MALECLKFWFQRYGCVLLLLLLLSSSHYSHVFSSFVRYGCVLLFLLLSISRFSHVLSFFVIWLIPKVRLCFVVVAVVAAFSHFVIWLHPMNRWININITGKKPTDASEKGVVAKRWRCLAWITIATTTGVNRLSCGRKVNTGWAFWRRHRMLFWTFWMMMTTRLLQSINTSTWRITRMEVSEWRKFAVERQKEQKRYTINAISTKSWSTFAWFGFH